MVLCRVAKADSAARHDDKLVFFRDSGGVAFNRDKLVVDGVSEVGPGETSREHRTETSLEHDGYRNLHRRAAAEVATCNENVIPSNGRCEGGIQVVEKVGLEYGWVDRVALASR